MKNQMRKAMMPTPRMAAMAMPALAPPERELEVLEEEEVGVFVGAEKVLLGTEEVGSEEVEEEVSGSEVVVGGGGTDVVRIDVEGGGSEVVGVWLC